MQVQAPGVIGKVSVASGFDFQLVAGRQLGAEAGYASQGSAVEALRELTQGPKSMAAVVERDGHYFGFETTARLSTLKEAFTNVRGSFTDLSQLDPTSTFTGASISHPSVVAVVDGALTLKR